MPDDRSAWSMVRRSADRPPSTGAPGRWRWWSLLPLVKPAKAISMGPRSFVVRPANLRLNRRRCCQPYRSSALLYNIDRPGTRVFRTWYVPIFTTSRYIGNHETLGTRPGHRGTRDRRGEAPARQAVCWSRFSFRRRSAPQAIAELIAATSAGDRDQVLLASPARARPSPWPTCHSAVQNPAPDPAPPTRPWRPSSTAR